VKKYGILYLSDEIICGFGRTGNWFGCQTFGVEPDMMSIAKGLSSGYAPIGGVVISGAVFEALSSEATLNGVFSHGFTYSGHPVSAAIAVEAMRIYQEMDLPKVATTLGQRLSLRLPELSDHPMVGNVRACGFLAGVELMGNKARNIPFEPDLKVGARVERASRARGLIVRNLGDCIAICPPYVVTEEEVDTLVGTLAHTLDDVYADIRAQER
jgi:4-aminobutyrate---pyruvate transaminase